MEDGSNIGPFSHLRKGAHLDRTSISATLAKSIVATLHEGVKMGHFSYIGDADVGAANQYRCGDDHGQL